MSSTWKEYRNAIIKYFQFKSPLNECEEIIKMKYSWTLKTFKGWPSYFKMKFFKFCRLNYWLFSDHLNPSLAMINRIGIVILFYNHAKTWQFFLIKKKKFRGLFLIVFFLRNRNVSWENYIFALQTNQCDVIQLRAQIHCHNFLHCIEQYNARKQMNVSTLVIKLQINQFPTKYIYQNCKFMTHVKLKLHLNYPSNVETYSVLRVCLAPYWNARR